MGSDSGRRRWVRRFATIALLAALLSPVVRNRDGLPLSTYPMYATARSNLVSFVTVRGFADEGDAVDLSMFTIARTRDPLIAESFLSDTVRRGEADRLCSDVADRVDDPVIRIEVATERFDVTDRSSGDPPLERTIHASCLVAP
ncbi:MAG: hypothetical protein ACN4GZ_08540 [Acidimicrobiales bacterium]